MTAERIGTADDLGKIERVRREPRAADLLPDDPEAIAEAKAAREAEADEIMADLFPDDPDAGEADAGDLPEGSALARQTAILEPGEEEPSGLQLVMDLEAAGAMNPVSLTLTDPTMPFERYTALGRLFGRVKRSSSWWIGDWLNFGEHAYGERYAQAAEATGLDPDTLMNYSYVARSVAKNRRRPGVGFSIHAEVAPLKPREQTKWLDKAEQEGWSRSTLRRALKEARDDGDDGAGGQVDPGDGLTTAERIAAIARDVWNQAQKDGGEFRVPAPPMERLAAALGVDR